MSNTRRHQATESFVKFIMRDAKSPVSIADLEAIYDKSPEKFEALTSQEAWLVMRDAKSPVSIADLEAIYDKSPEKFEALTSQEAWLVMRDAKSPVSISDLEAIYDKSPEKFEALTSQEAWLVMRDAKSPVSISDLEAIYDKSPEKFKALTSYDAKKFVSEEGIEFTSKMFDRGELPGQGKSFTQLLSESIKFNKKGSNYEITTPDKRSMSMLMERIDALKSPDTAVVAMGGSALKIAIKNPVGELGEFLKRAHSQHSNGQVISATR